MGAPTGTWRVGQFGGVDLLIKPSLLLMGAILVLVFAPRFENATATNPYLLALIFVVALYISVLFHELAHVVVARAYRMRVPSVTLHLMGGETAIVGDSRTPAQEFWTSVVGPIASLAFAGAAWIAADVVSEGSTRNVLWAVAFVNLVVGAVNLVPGMPLDGGRVFRALIWALTGDRDTGTAFAGWAGRVVAIGVLALPFLRARDSTTDRFVIDLALALLISVFLWAGATGALRQASRDRRLRHLSARNLAVPAAVPGDAPEISAELGGSDLVRAMAAHPAEVYRVVEHDGTTLGLLTAGSVDDAYRKGRT